MNVAYDETERRGIIALNLQSLLFTVLAVVAGLVAIAAVIAVPIAFAFLHVDSGSEFWISILRWPVLILAVWFALAVLYRFGPSREQPKWRWVTWGSALASRVLGARLQPVLLVCRRLRQLLTAPMGRSAPSSPS